MSEPRSPKAALGGSRLESLGGANYPGRRHDAVPGRRIRPRGGGDWQTGRCPISLYVEGARYAVRLRLACRTVVEISEDLNLGFSYRVATSLSTTAPTVSDIVRPQLI